MPESVTDGGGLCSYLSLSEVGGGVLVDVKIDTDGAVGDGSLKPVQHGREHH